jgi:hypothetical protein
LRYGDARRSRSLGYEHVTVHGFRATFATWAEECTDYSDGVREGGRSGAQIKNETVAAHQRGAKLEKRRALMNDWTKHVCGEPTVAAMRDVAQRDPLDERLHENDPMGFDPTFVIPGCVPAGDSRSERRPGIHSPCGGYGFRARLSRASRVTRGPE